MVKKEKGLSLKIIIRVMAIITGVITICLIISLFLLTNTNRRVNELKEDFLKLEKSANDLEQASDYLTEQVRYYVVTGEDNYYHEYFREVNETKRRENALDSIRNNIDDVNAATKLERALNESNSLMNTEFYAFRLVIESLNGNIDNYQEVKDVVLSDADLALSNEQKKTKAIELVFSQEYNNSKDTIEANVNNCIDQIIDISNQAVEKANKSLIAIITIQQILIFSLVIILFVEFFTIYYELILPLNRGSELILQGKNLRVEGFKEYRILSQVYNETKKRDDKNKDILTYEVEHDKLTGLYNRNGYDALYPKLNLKNTAYVLIDIDNFKKINDRYGHAVGDKVLKKVGTVLKKYFRSDDYLCRIGGDEFAILLADCNSEIASQLRDKGERINLVLQAKEGEIPSITLSIGVAFGDEHDDTDSLFKKADKALYQTKRSGRSGITIFNNNIEIKEDEKNIK